MKILLDYFFPITAISPTPQASTAFLKQACVVVLPKDGGVTPGEAVLCTTSSEIAALTNNVDALQLLAAGMSRVWILPVDDLDLADALEAVASEFYTVLISSDFDDADIAPTQAQGVFTVSSYANLVSGTADTVTIAGVTFTAQSGAATLGDATFRAATSNDATAASLAAQINAHATAKTLVVATVVNAVVTVKAKNAGSAGNDIAASYTDNDTNVGGAWTGLTGGKLAGGDGLFLGEFTGVVGISSNDDANDGALESYAATENYCAFYTSGSNGAKNMCYAFGKLLSNASDWLNQQYITMPFADDVDTLGEANNLFDQKISFVLEDDEFGKRLGLFVCGGEAIVAPYIKKNLEIDLQSTSLSYVSGNQPDYSLKHAALLEDEMQKVIDTKYIGRGWIRDGVVEVTLPNENFVAAADINIAKPTALWRLNGTIKQTL